MFHAESRLRDRPVAVRATLGWLALIPLFGVLPDQVERLAQLFAITAAWSFFFRVSIEALLVGSIIAGGQLLATDSPLVILLWTALPVSLLYWMVRGYGGPRPRHVRAWVQALRALVRDLRIPGREPRSGARTLVVAFWLPLIPLLQGPQTRGSLWALTVWLVLLSIGAYLVRSKTTAGPSTTLVLTSAIWLLLGACQHAYHPDLGPLTPRYFAAVVPACLAVIASGSRLVTIERLYRKAHPRWVLGTPNGNGAKILPKRMPAAYRLSSRALEIGGVQTRRQEWDHATMMFCVAACLVGVGWVIWGARC